MAKYLLLGNGFDLHHNLPTLYIDVLHMFVFLENKSFDNEGSISIGSLLSSYVSEYSDDTRMRDFYQLHKEHLNSVQISKATLSEYVKKLKNNCWYKYICHSYQCDISWVDFEQIIAEVLDVFRNQFELETQHYNLPLVFDADSKWKFFACFDNIYVMKDEWFEYRTEFLTKKIYEDKKRLQLPEIVEALYLSLVEFQELLSFYFEYFIDKTIPALFPSTALDFLSDVSFVVNLNYTSTYETLYHIKGSTTRITYYHGKATAQNIVLGIQSSVEDEYHNGRFPDTMFIKFKKFYQRINGNCDVQYVDFVSHKKEYEKKYGNNAYFKKQLEEHPHQLVVLGHSLDVTDNDIIKSLFALCGDISVYYHDNDAYGKYIVNLTKIFGRSDFEEMRNCGKIKFVKLEPYNPKIKEQINDQL